MYVQDFMQYPKNRPFLRNPTKYKITEVRALVLHWTGNKNRGADADNNKRYFDNAPVFASAQICVDDRQILQTMPLLEVAYHCGGRRYTDFGKELMQGYPSPNYVTIGVEACVNKDGDFKKTYRNTVHTFASLLIETGLWVNHITTHHRITGKDCPQFPIGKNGDFVLIEGLLFDKFLLDVEIEYWGLRENRVKFIK